MKLQLKLRWPFKTSAAQLGYLSRYMLDQVTVSMFTGLSQKHWKTTSGSDMSQDLNVNVLNEPGSDG